jgi:hypothetical protein
MGLPAPEAAEAPDPELPGTEVDAVLDAAGAVAACAADEEVAADDAEAGADVELRVGVCAELVRPERW